MTPIRPLLLAMILCLGSAIPAPAQQAPQNCTLEMLENPPRQAMICAGGLVIEMTTAVELGFVARAEGPPRLLELRRGSLLIEVEPGAEPTRIRTPNAIAAVRGTVYAIEVAPERSSVLVLRGSVQVRHRGSLASVALGPGQGVDVVTGRPLEVKTWGAARVRKLLSQFGR